MFEGETVFVLNDIHKQPKFEKCSVFFLFSYIKQEQDNIKLNCKRWKNVK